MGSAFARTLSRLAPRRLRGPVSGAGTPRIAVLGNCQGGAVATAMRLLLPDAEVAYLSVYRLTKRFPRMADLVRELRAFDVVFAAGFAAPFRDGGDFETLRAAVNLVQMPLMVFSAYHPDVVYVGDVHDTTGGSFVRGPVGTYHSAIALYGFRQGLSVEATLRLYDAEVYRLLGYLSVWDNAQETLLGLGRDAGFDLAPYLLRWTRRGCFMHLINHPRMFVACDLARGLLTKAGAAFEDCDLDTYAADEIVGLGSWPVYPPIAAAFGLRGDHVFLSPGREGAAPRTLGLRAFVERSFAAYRAAPPARLACERVDIWRETPELVAELSARAG